MSFLYRQPLSRRLSRQITRLSHGYFHLEPSLMTTAVWAQRSYATKFRSKPKMYNPVQELSPDMTEEERQIKILELQSKIPDQATFSKTVQELPVLDFVILPPFLQVLKKQGVKSAKNWIVHEAKAWVGNVLHMFQLVKFKVLPGMTKIPSALSPGVLRLRSTRKGAWVAKLREQALARYIEFNTAQANGDVKTIRNIAGPALSRRAQERLHSRAGARLVWKYHGEARPTRCLSVRVIPDVGFGLPPAQAGAQQILIRFDTYQTLAVYSKGGDLVSGGPDQKKRVTDYIVFEHKNWDTAGWRMKAQLYETNQI